MKKPAKKKVERLFISDQGVQVKIEVESIEFDVENKVYRLYDDKAKIIGWIPGSWIAIASPDYHPRASDVYTAK